jgi:hypothetical protein
MNIMESVFEFEADQISSAFSHLRAAGTISPGEWDFFCLSRHLAQATNRLYEAWFRRVVVPYQSIPADMREEHKRRLCEMLPKYDYTVFDYDPATGVIANREAWATAFPDEIVELRRWLKIMNFLPMRGLREYFSAFAAAYGETDIEKLEERWKAVDFAMIHIPNTSPLVPMQGIESQYEHPCCVSPEYRLEVRTTAGEDVIASKRKAVLDHAAHFGLSNELMSLAVQKLDRIDAAVFIPAVRSGVGLNFGYAGQAGPNRQDVTAEGGRIFMEGSASAEKAKLYRAKIEKHCIPATAGKLTPFVTAHSQLVATTTHEFTHPLGRTEESDTALGSDGMGFCEEGKATLLGILASEHEDPSPENRLALVANMLGRSLRFMEKAMLENATFAAYVRENLAALSMFLDTGVIELGKKGVRVDIKKAQSLAWFGALRAYNHIVLDAYRAHDKAVLKVLADRMCNKDEPRIAALIAWVNRP